MSALFGERVTLAQENGPDVELLAWGDEFYATYETPSGYPAVYDKELGLFCYARVVEGRFESTKVPVSEPPPAGVELHARESDAVRMAKAAEQHAGSHRRRTEPGKEKP
jgi:hypothetical protein